MALPRVLFTLYALVIAVQASSIHNHQYGKCTNTTGKGFAARNLKTIKTIYDTTIFPNNQKFLTEGISAIPPGLFNEHATGRISPFGNFSGAQDTAEYFFGLTPPPQAPLYDTWTEAKIVSFQSGCPEVAASVVWGITTGVNPNFTATYGKQTTTIKQYAFWRFDDSGAVLNYDAYLPNLNPYTTALYGTGPTPQFQQATIQQICTNTQALCTGANTQYSSVGDCQGQLNAKPYGEWDEAWGDNVVCRFIHVLLAKLRPDIHCVHVGPTGGGKCVDIAYNDVYFDDEALFGAPTGETFTCPS
ncbi:hypothetical protein MMC25_000339 [Agyrium rufum]|nr:hypothetical protein [Agyrium rufum]